jgi:hypothetical protein
MLEGTVNTTIWFSTAVQDVLIQCKISYFYYCMQMVNKRSWQHLRI